MKKINKKAFTIVELVIVIAIIAILAAVLIPTFIRLIRKSKVNNDTQLIRNLNVALESEKSTKTHETMSDALAVASVYGYDVARINASATNNEILWDSKNDVFCYLNDGVIEYLPDSVEDSKKLGANDYRLWKIYTKAPASGDNYSLYVGSQEVADYVNANDLNVGIDCGEYSIENVSYKGATTESGARTVAIRTNGGTLTVNAPYDTVKHYGEGGIVNVQAVADASYHEFGKVAFLKIASGRMVAEENAKVSTLYIQSADVKIQIEEKAEVTLTAKAEGIVIAEENVVGIAQESVQEKTEEDIQKFQTAATRYDGGNGSAAYPFLISKAEQIDVSLREDVALGGYIYSYKLTADIDLGNNFVPIGALSYIVNGPSSVSVDISNTKAFLGNLDGQNHTIKLRQRGDLACLFYSIANYNTTIKNLTLDVDLHSTRNACALAIQTATYANKSLTIENVTVKGNIVGESGAAGFFMTFLNSNGATGIMRNCTNYANITVTKFNASNYVMCCGFVGQSSNTKYNTTILFENCRNEGDLVCDIDLPTVNSDANKYNAIMGHICGQVANSSYTAGSVSTMKFINCSFRETAKLIGVSAKDGKKATFEGYDASAGKNTYIGEANFNKQLIGGNAPTNVFVGETEETAVEYVRTSTANYFAHGGTDAAPGRSTSTVANYPAE